MRKGREFKELCCALECWMQREPGFDVKVGAGVPCIKKEDKGREE